MLSLEGDFQVEDFVEADSDLAVGVGMINDRFSDEGEPPRAGRRQHHQPDGDPSDRGCQEEHELTWARRPRPDLQDAERGRGAPRGGPAALVHQGGDGVEPDPVRGGGLGLRVRRRGYRVRDREHPNREMDFIYVPIVDDSRCLSFLFGFMLTRGVPASGGYPPYRPA